MSTLALVLLGVGLAAATGFRIFVPPLVLAVGYRLDLVSLPNDAAWLDSTAALIVLGIATVAEVLAYYLPLIDNLLDTVAGPAALVAGTIVAGTVLPGADPWLRWTAAMVLGGSSAGAVQALTSVTRAASTGATAGLANPILATGELIGAFSLALLSLIAPALAALAVLLLLVFGARIWRRGRFRSRSNPVSDQED